jgi:pimeloyl-[acyl-carrier protein] methyl ester esterase
MSLHVETYGSGNPLALIHGWGMNGGVWQPVVEQLSQHFCVYVVDLPGMGFSMPMHLDDESSAHHLNVIAAKVAELLPENTDVCGWSFGALVAMSLALQQPKRVGKLVLVGATPKFVNHADWQYGMDASIFQQFADNISQDYETTLMRFLTLQCMRSSDARNTIKQLRASFAKRPVPTLAALQSALGILLETDLRATMQQLDKPALLVHGDRDSLAPVQAAHWLAEHLPSARLQVINGASHAPFLSHPEVFIALLLAFLQPIN